MTPTVPLAIIAVSIIEDTAGAGQNVAAGIVAAIAGLAVVSGTAALMWQLWVALVKAALGEGDVIPKLKRALIGTLAAVFAIGATPGLVSAVYNAGLNFGAGG